MHLEAFLDLVQTAGGLTREEADRATQATLRTLGERITRGEADDLAAFLPRELRGVLASGPEPAEAFGLDEFLRRIAEREGVDAATARRDAEAVFEALGQTVAPKELRDLVAQLPHDFQPLLATANLRREQARDDPLVRRVAQLTSLDLPAARRAVEAVLEVLAIRISSGEVEDLMERLPADLRPALAHGLAQSKQARRMSLEEFLDLVAERAGVGREDAERYARAVFAALRELVPSKEIYDVESELPGEYAPLFSNVL
jgi:uncharacterized protein (DUF2267 family)